MKNQKLTRGRRAVRLLIIVVVLVIVAVSVFMLNKSDKTAQVTSQTSVAQVRITKKGFEPAVLSVKPGTLVIWTNDDEGPHEIASNPYPENADLPDLKSELLNNTQTYQYKAEKSGTFNYHDQLKPTINGTLVVKNKL